MSSATDVFFYREEELTVEQRLQKAYEKGRTVEREAIRQEVQSRGYDWSHDPNVSGVQHVLNYLDERAEGL